VAGKGGAGVHHDALQVVLALRRAARRGGGAAFVAFPAGHSLPGFPLLQPRNRVLVQVDLLWELEPAQVAASRRWETPVPRLPQALLPTDLRGTEQEACRRLPAVSSFPVPCVPSLTKAGSIGMVAACDLVQTSLENEEEMHIALSPLGGVQAQHTLIQGQQDS